MAALTIVGLGPAGAELLTREAHDVLVAADELHVRTRRHPTLGDPGFPFQGRLRSFDALYRRAGSLEEVYRTIAERLIRLARRRQGVVYAVPGHPTTGERSVRLALALAREAGIPTRVVAGLSFLEPTLAAVGAEPLAEGLQIVDAAALVANHFGVRERRDPFAARTRLIEPTAPALITQLDSKRLAAGVKLVLSEWLPPAHEVALVRGAGGAEQAVRRAPLAELDRLEVDHLSSLHVPALAPLEDVASFEGLRHVVARLRAPGGCPWDREQSHASLKSGLIEEAYEAVEAIDAALESDDWDGLVEELGDLLVNVLLHTQIAAESERFWLEDVLRTVNAKLIRRHPHVFGDLAVAGSAEVLANWERIKRAEKGERPEASRLGEVPVSLPALARAQTIQRRAARAGFAWDDVDGAWAKLDEELAELRAAGTPPERAHELGDVLWMAGVLGTYMNVDAEDALRGTARKFVGRFRALEALVGEADMKELGTARLLELYSRVKDAEPPGA